MRALQAAANTRAFFSLARLLLPEVLTSNKPSELGLAIEMKNPFLRSFFSPKAKIPVRSKRLTVTRLRRSASLPASTSIRSAHGMTITSCWCHSLGAIWAKVEALSKVKR